MFMPKTTIDEYYSFILWQNNIRTPWQLFNIFSVSEAFAKKIMPNLYFRLRVFASNM